MAGLPWFKQSVDLKRDPRSLILGDILGDPRAWTYVVEMRMYLAENAPTGCVSGLRAPVALERGSGWTGERGGLIAALRDAGFIRVGPARDGEGTEIEDLDWAREQGAHVKKFESDAKKPRGNTHKVVSPSRDTGGTDKGPDETPRGESREFRVENSSPSETAPDGQSDLFPPPGTPAADTSVPDDKAGKRSRKQRAPTKAESLYVRLQESRRKRCEQAGVAFVPDHWNFAQQNSNLGPVAGLPEPDWLRFAEGWNAYLADDARGACKPPWSLGYFLNGNVRARYETEAIRNSEAA